MESCINGIVGLLLLPPLNLLLLACLGAALQKRRAGRIMLTIGLAGMVLFALPVVPGMLMGTLESGFATTPQGARPQAVVILSGDEDETRIGPATAFRPGPLTLEREQAGAALARVSHLPVLVSGGAIHSYSPPLAAIMTTSLLDDFATNVRWQENKSLDTWQNARLSAAILKGQGISSVYIVTHAWHMKRALLAFRHAGMTVTAAPVAIDASMTVHAASFMPSARAWLESYYAVHELVGLAWYAIRG